MKSTLFNMVTVLFAITLIASALVGVVYMVTEGPISEADNKAKSEALKNVLPEFDASEKSEVELDGMPIVVNTATKAGEVIGYAVETRTKNGFGGEIVMMVGFDKDGNVLNINVLKQAETPGLGTKMCDEGNPLLASAKAVSPANPAKFQVSKDGGELDALTAATISSRAYYDAVSRAYRAVFSDNNAAQGESVKVEELIKQTKDFPEYDVLSAREVQVDELPIKVYSAIKNKQVVGYAVETVNKHDSYGNISALVTFDLKGNIVDAKVLSSSGNIESAMLVEEPENVLVQSIRKTSPANEKAYCLKMAGGELDVLSGATVTSQSFYDAVKRAYKAYSEVANVSESSFVGQIVSGILVLLFVVACIVNLLSGRRG